MICKSFTFTLNHAPKPTFWQLIAPDKFYLHKGLEKLPTPKNLCYYDKKGHIWVLNPVAFMVVYFDEDDNCY